MAKHFRDINEFANWNLQLPMSYANVFVKKKKCIWGTQSSVPLPSLGAIIAQGKKKKKNSELCSRCLQIPWSPRHKSSQTAAFIICVWLQAFQFRENPTNMLVYFSFLSCLFVKEVWVYILTLWIV